MTVNSQAKTSSSKLWMGLNLIEILVLMTVIAIVVVLLIPQPEWVSSGEVTFPVKVFVFDAVSGEPIKGAHVGVYRGGLGVYSEENSQADLIRWPAPEDVARFLTESTTADGVVVVEQRFYTGASDQRPESHTHLSGAWVFVAMDGYGGVTVPVRFASMETANLREQGEIFAPIGLAPRKVESESP